MMEQQNRRGFFTFIGQCLAAAFVAPAVLPKVAEAMEPITELNGIDLSGYVKPVDFDSLPVHGGGVSLSGYWDSQSTFYVEPSNGGMTIAQAITRAKNDDVIYFSHGKAWF